MKQTQNHKREWRIEYHVQDRSPVEKVMTGTFREAWNMSLPHPEEREDRHILWKHNVKALFDAGNYSIIVSRDVENPWGTYTVIACPRQ